MLIIVLATEVERQLQGGVSSSPRLSSKKSQGHAQSHSQSQSRPVPSVMTSRSNTNTAPVQMRRATNTKGKPVPAPPKRTRYRNRSFSAPHPPPSSRPPPPGFHLNLQTLNLFYMWLFWSARIWFINWPYFFSPGSVYRPIYLVCSCVSYLPALEEASPPRCRKS